MKKSLFVILPFLLIACGGNVTSSENVSSSETNISEVSSSEIISSEQNEYINAPITSFKNLSNNVIVSSDLISNSSINGFTKNQEVVIKINEEVAVDKMNSYLLYNNGMCFRAEIKNAPSDELSFYIDLNEDNNNFVFIRDSNKIVDAGFSIEKCYDEYYGFYGFDDKSYYEPGKRVTFKFYHKLGYKVEKLEYRLGSSSYQELDITSISDCVGSYSLTLSDSLSFKVTGSYIGTSKINYVNQEAVDGNLINEAVEGDEVNISYKAKSDYYIIDVASISGVDNIINNDINGNISFIMPKNDVEITFNLANRYAYEVNNLDNVNSYKILSSYYDLSSSVNKFIPGEMYYLYVEPKQDYVFFGASIYGEDYETQISEEGIEFVPFICSNEEDIISIALDIKPIRNIKINTNYGGTISQKKNAYCEGQKVELYCQFVSPLYYVESAKIVELNKEITFVEDIEKHVASFAMPDIDITIEVSFAKYDGINITSNILVPESGYYEIIGNSSKQNLNSYSETSTKEFIKDETISIYFNMTSNKYIPETLVVLDKENNLNKSYSFASIALKGYISLENIELFKESSNITFSVSFKEHNVVNYEIVDDGVDNYELHYFIDEVEVESLGTLYPGDTFLISSFRDSSDDKELLVSVLDKEGNPLENRNNEYIVSGDFIIKVELVDNITLTINNHSGLNISWGKPSLEDASGNLYYSGDKIARGTSLSLAFQASGNFKVEIYIDEELIYNDVAIYKYGNATLTYTFIASSHIIINIYSA